jgi:hypothetical protein
MKNTLKQIIPEYIDYTQSPGGEYVRINAVFNNFTGDVVFFLKEETPENIKEFLIKHKLSEKELIEYLKKNYEKNT